MENENKSRLAEVVLCDYFKVPRPTIETAFDIADMVLNGKTVDIKCIYFKGSPNNPAYMKQKVGKKFDCDYYLAVRTDGDVVVALGWIPGPFYEKNCVVMDFGHEPCNTFPVEQMLPYEWFEPTLVGALK